MTYHALRSAGDEPRLLLTLHGTGGTEEQFHAFGQRLLPGAHITSPRGDVSESGALRYFKRLSEGRYDMDDLARATDKLGAFIDDERAQTGATRISALGYSNGANILAALSFQRPDLIDDLILLHPLIPFTPPARDFTGRRVLITAGKTDMICPRESTASLAQYYTQCGADLHLFWHEGGHEISAREGDAVRAFVAG